MADIENCERTHPSRVSWNDAALRCHSFLVIPVSNTVNYLDVMTDASVHPFLDLGQIGVNLDQS